MTSKPTPDDKDVPAELPSVPDHRAEPGDHNEPDVEVPRDRSPQTDFTLARTPTSAAELRMRIEGLLGRREAASPEAWAELGDDARAMLVDLLDDWSVRSNEALFHRTIAAVGNLRVKRAVVALSALLKDKSESNVTKAYAANALGRIGERTAVNALAECLGTKDEMVRRQVAMALGRIDDDAAIPHLLQLRGDSSSAVAEVASDAVQRWEQATGRQLGPRPKARRARGTSKKRPPPPEDR
jgi:hypothetical protein